MHITSLPSPYGIGSMGKAAYDFIDFLRAAKQTYWQILPINPPGYGDSPYQAFSTFAGNPYLIDLDELVKDGYLTQEELDRVDWGSRADQVDFSKMYDQRLRVLHLAWSRFHKAPAERYTEYVRQQSAWLEEYVLLARRFPARLCLSPARAFPPPVREAAPYRWIRAARARYRRSVYRCRGVSDP